MIENEIQDIKAEILRKITSATRRGNTSTILQVSSFLEQIDTIEIQYNHLKENLALLQRDFSIFEPTGRSQNRGFVSASSRRLRWDGNIERENLVVTFKNHRIPVERIDETTYRTPNGTILGVAFGGEKPERNRWFLGLRSDRYDAVALICSSRTGLSDTIFIDPNRFRHIKDCLSKAKGTGQLKFNVVRKGREYFLQVPNVGRLLLPSVNQLLEIAERPEDLVTERSFVNDYKVSQQKGNLSQQDCIKSLYRQTGKDWEKTIFAYAEAEERGIVRRESDINKVPRLQYAAWLFIDARRRGNL